MSLLGRVQGARYYRLSLKKLTRGARKWELAKREGAVSTRLAGRPYAYAENTYYTLRLNLNGASLAASLHRQRRQLDGAGRGH